MKIEYASTGEIRFIGYFTPSERTHPQVTIHENLARFPDPKTVSFDYERHDTYVSAYVRELTPESIRQVLAAVNDVSIDDIAVEMGEINNKLMPEEQARKADYYKRLDRDSGWGEHSQYEEP